MKPIHNPIDFATVLESGMPLFPLDEILEAAGINTGPACWYLCPKLGVAVDDLLTEIGLGNRKEVINSAFVDIVRTLLDKGKGNQTRLLEVSVFGINIVGLILPMAFGLVAVLIGTKGDIAVSPSPVKDPHNTLCAAGPRY